MKFFFLLMKDFQHLKNETILKRPNENESKIHEIARACGEVAKPILFSIVIIIVVFFPLLFQNLYNFSENLKF